MKAYTLCPICNGRGWTIRQYLHPTEGVQVSRPECSSCKGAGVAKPEPVPPSNP